MSSRIVSVIGRAVLSQSGKVCTVPARASSEGYEYDKSRPFFGSMNDLPVPSGSWEADYNAKQTKYNTQLAGGVIFTLITLIVGMNSGLLYGNGSPPPFPPEE